MLLAIVAFALTAAPALADRIDGTWCSPAGRTMIIGGRKVTTPAGNTLIGEYTRHTFNYIAPQGEADAGNRIWAEQLNDQTIRVTIYGGEKPEPGTPEIWSRCETIS